MTVSAQMLQKARDIAADVTLRSHMKHSKFYTVVNSTEFVQGMRAGHYDDSETVQAALVALRECVL
jgi:hypothetical protein